MVKLKHGINLGDWEVCSDTKISQTISSVEEQEAHYQSLAMLIGHSTWMGKPLSCIVCRHVADSHGCHQSGVQKALYYISGGPSFRYDAKPYTGSVHVTLLEGPRALFEEKGCSQVILVWLQGAP